VIQIVRNGRLRMGSRWSERKTCGASPWPVISASKFPSRARIAFACSDDGRGVDFDAGAAGRFCARLVIRRRKKSGVDGRGMRVLRGGHQHFADVTDVSGAGSARYCSRGDRAAGRRGRIPQHPGGLAPSRAGDPPSIELWALIVETEGAVSTTAIRSMAVRSTPTHRSK